MIIMVLFAKVLLGLLAFAALVGLCCAMSIGDSDIYDSHESFYRGNSRPGTFY